MDVTPLYHHAVPLPPGSSLGDLNFYTALCDVPGLASVALISGSAERHELAVSVVYLPTRAARHARLATPSPVMATSSRPLSGNRVLITFRAGWRASTRFDPIYLVVLDCNSMTFGTPMAVARANDTGGYGVYGMPGMHQASETEWTAVLIGLRNPPLDETDSDYGGGGPAGTGIWGFQSPLHPQKLGIIGGTSLPTGNLRWYDGYKYDFLTRRVSIRGTTITVDYSPWSVTAGFTAYLNPYYFNLVQNHRWLYDYSWTDEPGLLSTSFLYQDKMSYDRNYWDWDAAQGNYDQRNFLQRGETNFMAVQLSFAGQVLTGVQTTPLRTSIGGTYVSWQDDGVYPYHVGLMGPKVFGNGQVSVMEYTSSPWEPMFGGGDVWQPRRGRPGTVGSPEGPSIRSADPNYYRGGAGIWDSYRWHRAGAAIQMVDYPVTEGDWSGERWIDFRVGPRQGRIRSSRLASMPITEAMKVDLEPYGMPWGQFGDLIYTQSGCFVGLWSFTDLAAHGGLAISVFKVGDTGIDNLEHGQHRSKGVFS